MVNVNDLLPQHKSNAIYDYDSALAYIKASGEHNTETYVSYTGLKIRLDDDGSISASQNWSNRKLFSYLKNGVVRIEDMTDYSRISASLRRTIARYTNLVALDYVKGRFLIRRPSDKLTAVKKRKCDLCSGQSRLYYSCEGVEGGRRIITQVGELYADTKCSLDAPARYAVHRESIPCGKCKGEGKIPWGGKPIPMEWDRQVLYLDIATGLILDKESINS